MNSLISPTRKLAARVMEHASGDKRFKILETHMKRHQCRADALIEVLHKAQDLFGYLEEDVLLFVAYRLKVPTSRVYGVATFYHLFTLRPKGRHVCVLCLGTACYVKGAGELLATAQAFTRLKPGETTADRAASLLTARCLGACSLAPVVVYDGQISPHQTTDAVLEKLKGWVANVAE